MRHNRGRIETIQWQNRCEMNMKSEANAHILSHNEVMYLIPPHTCSANSVTTPCTLSSNSSFVFGFCFFTVSLTLEVGMRRQSNRRSI